MMIFILPQLACVYLFMKNYKSELMKERKMLSFGISLFCLSEFMILVWGIVYFLSFGTNTLYFVTGDVEVAGNVKKFSRLYLIALYSADTGIQLAVSLYFFNCAKRWA